LQSGFLPKFVSDPNFTSRVDPIFSDADRRAHGTRVGARANGLYTTTPNPRVGCVIVKDGEVIGEGWHRAGRRAARRDQRAGASKARGRDCTGRRSIRRSSRAITWAARAVRAKRSSPPVSRGRRGDGRSQTEAEGGTARCAPPASASTSACCESEARELNIGFVSRVTRGRPWVRLKAAASLDGRTALESGASQWITGEAARADGHRLRARACAILTGIGTVRRDDPQLTVRAVSTPRQPRRVVVDRAAETPPSARVLADGDAWVVTAGSRNPEWPPGPKC
jgi:diaminohydroxyphosphoribosylaminopyrimidine deaminase/5-amino-6-(5-phosphoribosylamino)uracil reductase